MENLKTLMALTGNDLFEVAPLDVRAEYLQAKTLDKEVYMKIPEDQRVEGYVRKLRKPLFGLDDASTKFWLKDTLVVLGFKVMPGDETFHYLHEDV